MLYKFEATVVFVLESLPEVVRVVTSRIRQNKFFISPCSSCLSTTKKPMVSCSLEVYCHIFLPIVVVLKRESMDTYSGITMLYSDSQNNAAYSSSKLLSLFPFTDII